MNNYYYKSPRGDTSNSLGNELSGVRAAKAVASDHGVHPVTVWRWAKDGHLDIVHIANRPYVTLSSLEEFHRKALAGRLARPFGGAARRSKEAAAEDAQKPEQTAGE
jgi:hypothetical protein